MESPRYKFVGEDHASLGSGFKIGPFGRVSVQLTVTK